MKRQIPLAELKDREYLTPAQAAHVFGRSRDKYVQWFKGGCINGYKEGRYYYLDTESIRRHLQLLSRPAIPHHAEVIHLAPVQQDSMADAFLKFLHTSEDRGSRDHN